LKALHVHSALVLLVTRLAHCFRQLVNNVVHVATACSIEEIRIVSTIKNSRCTKIAK
jgi:hypothetical protein